MRKTTLAAILFMGCLQTCYAQTEAPVVKQEKSTDQLVGVQVNELIQQVFNFNSSNTTTNANANPYLLTYSINSRNSGWGIRVGIGYNYNSSGTNDGITTTTTNINDVHVRLGVDKAYKISKKWSSGVGLDIVYNNNDDHTTSSVNTNFNNGNTIISGTDATDTKTTVSNYGGGPMAWLRYSITDRILIGTEASFYYVTGKQTQTISETVNGINNGNVGPNSPTNSNSVSQGTFNSPIAIFLHVRF